MDYSLNEIEALCRKAARGAGLAWGLAEEAARNTRWLAAHGLPGPALLAGLLTRNDGLAYETLAPLSLHGIWQASGGNLCPLIVGATLTDRAALCTAGQQLEFAAISYPLLLLPSAARLAEYSGMAVGLDWDGTQLAVDPHQALAIRRGADTLETSMATGVRCTLGVEHVDDFRPAHPQPLAMDAALLQQLEMLARRTYAPGSEISRLSGAGAGVLNHD